MLLQLFKIPNQTLASRHGYCVHLPPMPTVLSYFPDPVYPQFRGAMPKVNYQYSNNPNLRNTCNAEDFPEPD